MFLIMYFIFFFFQVGVLFPKRVYIIIPVYHNPAAFHEKVQKNTTQDQVWELIELGDLFVLGSELTPDFSKPHSVHTPQPDVAVAFHRDHGRPESPPFVLYSLNEYVAYGRTEIEAEYLYLFACETWFIYFLNGEQPPYWYVPGACRAGGKD